MQDPAPRGITSVVGGTSRMLVAAARYQRYLPMCEGWIPRTSDSGGGLVGTAYNLRTAADIAGTYNAVAAGLTVGAGAQVARFQNANGVILELVGAQVGLAVSLGSA